MRHLSSGRQSIWRRARSLAQGIVQKIGPEVLLLVVSSHNTITMATMKEQVLVQELRTWWDQVSHPSTLTTAAKECFASHIRDTTVSQVPEIPADAIPSGQAALSIFEKAINFAAQSISGPQDRDAWKTTALAHLHLLERLSRNVRNERSSAKVAILADLDRMKNYIGDYLHRGVRESRMRDGEKRKLTSALRLGLAYDSGEDFILELWICSLYGRSIEDRMSTMNSIEDWKDILGDYLYVAMKNSRSRKIEEEKGIQRTNAVRLSSPNGKNYDSKVEVMMSFDQGREVWDIGFP
ncbi:hypothetical protein IQ07DRAFT_340578 [Pyrenochaeta sp. DS3sAY3a]|nr:hypothetical protein IQ07DRAFT_340578 [Pyrenochaeta sp. DS3sAY3a]